MKNLVAKKWFAVLVGLIGCGASLLLAMGGRDKPLTHESRPALYVETEQVRKKDYRIQVAAWGLVEPRETIDIRSEISGKVTQAPAYIHPGARVERGALLFCIDERDYQNALAEAKAAHVQARQTLAIEQGRRVVAQTEWEMLESSKWRGQRNKTLALREPQLKEKKAAVQMAAAKLAQAALNLERARVSAPCDGVILTEQIAGGQYLGSDAVALRMACTDCYQVSANFSPEYSLDLNVRTVTVQVGRNHYQGRIKAVLPQIDTETRRKRALVEFKGQGVTLGAYASLSLPGPIFTNAIIIPKEALRAGNKIWLLNQGGRLEIRQVEVLGSDGVRVVVGRGLGEQDCIVLSHIASPLAGMELRTKEPDAPVPAGNQIGEGLDG